MKQSLYVVFVKMMLVAKVHDVSDACVCLATINMINLAIYIEVTFKKR